MQNDVKSCYSYRTPDQLTQTEGQKMNDNRENPTDYDLGLCDKHGHYFDDDPDTPDPEPHDHSDDFDADDLREAGYKPYCT